MRSLIVAGRSSLFTTRVVISYAMELLLPRTAARCYHLTMSDSDPAREPKAPATFPRNASAGSLALLPTAFGWLFFEPFEAPEVETRDDGVAVVKIMGPLEHDESYFADSYHAIRDRFDSALATTPKAVLLYINSPGGLVEGCFELAEYMRAESARTGIPLYAYGEGMMCSAAYALACSAQKIGASKTTMVGSIGVIDCLVDATAMDEAWGMKYRLITSGARKADGNPHQPIDDGAVLATQQRVDDLAGLFFDWVGQARSQLGADGARSLEAAVLIGARALSAGMLDVLADPSVHLTESSPTTETTTMQTEPTQPKAEDKPADDKTDGDMYRKLRKMAEEGDEDAKRMLQRLMDDDEHDEPDGDEKMGDEKMGDKKMGDKRMGDEAKAIALRALAAVERQERAALIASRPDFDEATRELLAHAPLESVRAHVAKAPKRTSPDRAASAQPNVRPTAQPGSAKDRAPHALTPPVTQNDIARHALANRLIGNTQVVVGSRLERDATGRVAKVEFGVDRDLVAGERNPDRLAAVRLRGASPVTRID
jgi:ClpP class serine protease